MEGMSLGILDDGLLVEGLSHGINERVSNGSVEGLPRGIDDRVSNG